VYFLERRDSKLITASEAPSMAVNSALVDAEEIETLPEGSAASHFDPRPVTSAGVARANSMRDANEGKKGWFNFFGNVNKKALIDGSMALPRSAPVKVDPKVFFANERTFLAWLHVSVILAGASVAIVAFSDSKAVGGDQLYGVILLPVSIAFIVYAMMQCEFNSTTICVSLCCECILFYIYNGFIFVDARRASMIRRKAPGPYGKMAKFSNQILVNETDYSTHIFGIAIKWILPVLQC
jgi:uncharacterized membrane protein YidH (DUF202 family)